MGLFTRKEKVEFLAITKKDENEKPMKFKTKDSEDVEFKAKRRPQRRVHVKFKAKNIRIGKIS